MFSSTKRLLRENRYFSSLLTAHNPSSELRFTGISSTRAGNSETCSHGNSSVRSRIAKRGARAREHRLVKCHRGRCAPRPPRIIKEPLLHTAGPRLVERKVSITDFSSNRRRDAETSRPRPLIAPSNACVLHGANKEHAPCLPPPPPRPSRI